MRFHGLLQAILFTFLLPVIVFGFLFVILLVILQAFRIVAPNSAMMFVEALNEQIKLARERREAEEAAVTGKAVKEAPMTVLDPRLEQAKQALKSLGYGALAKSMAEDAFAALPANPTVEDIIRKALKR